MEKAELIQFLKDNLKIELKQDFEPGYDGASDTVRTEIVLKLDDVILSEVSETVYLSR